LFKKPKKAKNRKFVGIGNFLLIFLLKIFANKRAIDGIAPNFLEKPIIKSDPNGKRLSFECKIKSDPEPTIKWYHGQEELSDKGRHLIYCDKLSNDTYFAGLEIDDVSKADAGKYNIHAKNTLGESTGSISLNFESKYFKVYLNRINNKKGNVFLS
jgi:hypothetical protein